MIPITTAGMVRIDTVIHRLSEIAHHIQCASRPTPSDAEVAGLYIVVTREITFHGMQDFICMAEEWVCPIFVPPPAGTSGRGTSAPDLVLGAEPTT